MLVERQKLAVFLGDGRGEGLSANEVREMLQDVQRRRRHSLGTNRGNDVKPLMDDFHFQVFSSHRRITVEVEHPFFFPVDDDALFFHRLDAAVLVEGTGKQLDGEGGYIQYGKRFQNGDVHHPVGQ